MSFKKQVAVAILLCSICFTNVGAKSDIDGLNLTEIVRLRRFIAEEHFVTTSDGYILNVIRILNPLINGGKKGIEGKRPILFVHGESAKGSIYVIHSQGVGPKDYSCIDTRSISENNLNKLFKDDPNSNSLVFLASSFGHEVWILNRRGNPDSRGHVRYNALKNTENHSSNINLTQVTDACASGNPNEGEFDANKELSKILNVYQSGYNEEYWSFSEDEQARYDMPDTIDYIIKHSQSDKVAVVGHSSGSAITMMMLADQPEMDNKISSTIHLAPSMYQPRSEAIDKYHASAIEPALSNFTGPFSLTMNVNQVNCLITRACHEEYEPEHCDNDPNPPKDRIGNDMKAREIMMNHTGLSVSARQTLQLVAQQRRKGRLHFYDYYSEEKNLLAYGKAEAPAYNVSRINSTTMSFFHGQFDRSATPPDIDLLIGSLKVPVKNNFFNSSDIYFDHSSPLIHLRVSTLVNIPALKEIESHEKERLSSSCSQTLALNSFSISHKQTNAIYLTSLVFVIASVCLSSMNYF